MTVSVKDGLAEIFYFIKYNVNKSKWIIFQDITQIYTKFTDDANFPNLFSGT